MSNQTFTPGIVASTDFALFEVIPGMRVLFSPDAPRYTIQAVTRDFCTYVGRTKEQLVGMGVFEAFPANSSDPADKGKSNLLTSFEHVLLQKEAHQMPIQRYDVQNEKGEFSEMYWKVGNFPVFNPEGDIAYIIHTTEDITEEIKASDLKKKIVSMEQVEVAIKKSEQNFRNTILQAPVSIGILKGPQFIVEIANDSMYELWGRGKEALQGKPIFEGLPEAKDQGFEELLTGVFTSGERFTAHNIPVTLPRSSGIETIYVDLLYEAYREVDGTITGVIVVATDVSEQVIARMKIEDSNRELGFIMNIMPQMVWHTGADGNADLFNQVYMDYTGLTLEQLKEKQWIELLHPEDLIATQIAWGKALAGENDHYMVEHRLRGKDGTYNWFLTRGVPLKNDEGETLKWYGTSTNIQEQKENEARFRLMANSLPIVIWTASPDGGLTFISNQWEAEFGNPIAESLGSGWAKFVHPDDIQQAAHKWTHSLQSGEDYETEFRVQYKGNEYRWLLVRAIPIRSTDGNIIQWYGSNTEIQDKKRFEEQLERRVKERTQELEQFTYVSHHDLQEPLRKIVMFTNLIKSETAEKLSEVAQKRLDKVVDAGHRMSQALRDLLNFASLSKEEQLVDTDLNEVVTTVQSDLELLIQEKDAMLQYDRLPTIKAIPSQMQQLFYNLINNALKFSRPNQKPSVVIKCEKLIDQELLNDHGLAQYKSCYKFMIQDNGIGFNEEAAEKIFVMFQRLHSREAYAGTGIGLTLCKKVVQNHHGKIWAESMPNAGATFTVLLPVQSLDTLP
jgi:PAS domain S-box-containing protein